MTIVIVDEATQNPIAGFGVSQAGAASSFSLSPTSQSVASGVGTEQIQVTSPVSWTAVSTQGWVSINAPDSVSPVSYNVAANNTASARGMTIVFLDSNAQPLAGFTVNQAAAANPFSISPSSSLNATPSGYSGTASVTAPFTWKAMSTQSWVSVTWDSTTLYYTATANNTGAARSMTILIEDSLGNVQAGFTVAQGANSSQTVNTLGINLATVPLDLYFSPNLQYVAGCSSPSITVQQCYKELFVTDPNNFIGQGITDVRFFFGLGGGNHSTPFIISNNT